MKYGFIYFLNLFLQTILINSAPSNKFLICLHTNPSQNFDEVKDSLDLLDLVFELGAHGIRTDVVLAEIEPEVGRLNYNAVAYYKIFFQECQKLNMNDSMIILSSPPK